MRQAKIGAIFLMSVITLAGVGAGYAAWTDTVFINGYITTGSVDLNIVGYSGTWVWKDLATDECITTARNEPPTATSMAVAAKWVIMAYPPAKSFSVNSTSTADPSYSAMASSTT